MNELDLSGLEAGELLMDEIPMGDYEMYQEPPPEEEVVGSEKRTAIIHIQIYLITFPEKLKRYEKVDLEKCSMAKLSSLKEEMDLVLSQRNMMHQVEGATIQGINLLEYSLCNFTPIKAQGLSKNVLDQAMLDDVKHMALKRATILNTEPELRIAFRLLTTVLMLHSANEQREQLEQTEIPHEKPAISATKTVALEKLSATFGDL